MAFESDPIASKLNEFVSTHEAYMWLSWFDELKPAEQALLAIWELEQEVYNGGFPQYFQNSSGDRVPVISDILRTVGADKAAAVVESAIALVGPNIPWQDHVKRYRAVEELSGKSKDKLHDLGRELYDELDNLNALLFRYLSRHREQLDAPADFWTEATTQ